VRGVVFDLAFLVASALLLRTLSDEFIALLQRALQAQERRAALALALLLYGIYGWCFEPAG
jgi:hypothetical protein